MSYAGNATRTRGARGVVGSTSASTTAPAVRTTSGPGRPTAAGRHDEGEIEWRQVAILAVGLAIGLVAGASTALLVAPQSGEETRAAIARRGRRIGRRTHDAWDDLRDELRFATRRGRRKVRRALGGEGLLARREERLRERERARAMAMADAMDC